MIGRKSERELQNDLLNAATAAVKGYEQYLLDEVGWMELAKIMITLRNSVSAVDAKKLDSNTPKS